MRSWLAKLCYVVFSAILFGVAMFSLCGCASLTQVETRAWKTPEGVWVVKSKSDAMVTVEKDKIIVDNRGRLGFWEGLLQYMLMKPDIEIEKD